MSEDGAIRVSLHQPNFLPWTKLFDKILASDVYIAYDSVQYTHSEFHARQWITGRGRPGVAVGARPDPGPGRQPLYAAELVPGRAWRDAHLRLLTEHYRGAPVLPRGDAGAGEDLRRRRPPAGGLQSAPLNGARVLLLGVTYKPDVADQRESPVRLVGRKLCPAAPC